MPVPVPALAPALVRVLVGVVHLRGAARHSRLEGLNLQVVDLTSSCYWEACRSRLHRENCREDWRG